MLKVIDIVSQIRSIKSGLKPITEKHPQIKRLCFRNIQTITALTALILLKYFILSMVYLDNTVVYFGLRELWIQVFFHSASVIHIFTSRSLGTLCKMASYCHLLA